jgi:maltose acetyltransferase-like protein
MRDRMLRGELYIADDPDLASECARAQELLDRYNRTVHVSRMRAMRSCAS